MPETSFYYHLAYGMAFVIYGGYALSLFVRRKRLRDAR
jgi:hypothetical protein